MNALDGDFAFCLYDPKANKVMVGRDRMGVVPLYIGHTVAGSILFASEMKALHSSCVEVQQVEPGSILTFTYAADKGIWIVSEERTNCVLPTTGRILTFSSFSLPLRCRRQRQSVSLGTPTPTLSIRLDFRGVLPPKTY